MELLELQEIRQLPGRTKGYVYFLFKGDELIYIGKTNSLGQRIYNHKNQRLIDFDYYKFIQVESEDLLECEYAYIRKFRPPLNKTLNHDDEIEQIRKETRLQRRIKYNEKKII